MLKTFIISLYVLSSITSICTDGCSICRGDACLLCDFRSGFITRGTGCSEEVIPNCDVPSNRGGCLICTDEFYLNATTGKCTPMPAVLPVENCMTPLGETTCGVCEEKFALVEGKCVAISNPVENCSIENVDGVCQECKPGFLLNSDGLGCTEAPQVDSCASFTSVGCLECSAGFVKNKNFYLQQNYSASSPNFEAAVSTYFLDVLFGRVDGGRAKVCQAVRVQNCVDFESASKCRQCAPNYFLTEKKGCHLNPSEAIPNCQIYSSQSVCERCMNGFQMESPNVCVEVHEVKKCVQYSSDPMKKKHCVLCEKGFFLQSANTCKPRKKENIENCSELSPTSETCEVCGAGYMPTTDGVKCLELIENCTRYVFSNFLSESLKCDSCEKGFFYDVVNGICKKGERENCYQYEKTQDVCVKCVNKFYLSEGDCIAHEQLNNCEIYHPTLKDVCLTCNNETFRFENENRCIEVEPIENCEKYASKDKCEVCKEEYFLTEDGCELIPVNEHCLRRNGTKCGKCVPDHVLENGECKDPLDYIVNECEFDNIDGTSSYEKSKCHGCRENSFPMNYKDSYVCVENHYMMKLMNSDVLLNNCLHYKKEHNGEYKCTKCEEGFFVDDGACVQECTTVENGTAYKQMLKVHNLEGDKHNESFSIDKTNVCGPTIPNCKVAAPGINQEKVELLHYECVECNEGNIAVVEFDDHKTMIRNPNNPNAQFGVSPVSEEPAFKCEDPLNPMIEIVGNKNEETSMVDNCAFYQKLGPITGCLKCDHGYTGVVVNVVNACAVYDGDPYTCKECIANYYLADPHECKQAETIEFCNLYDSTSNTTTCLRCEDSKYLDGGECIQRVNSLNVQNSTVIFDADNVDCDAGFFKDDSQPTLKCINMGPNCIDGSMSNNTFVCGECDHSISYLDDTGTPVCVLGAKSDCKTYADDANTCIECHNGYYKSNGNCFEHTATDANCVTWDGDTSNVCTTCGLDSILFTVGTKCREITTPISQCKVYESLTTCLECNPNYRLENLKTRCLPIQGNLNCRISMPLDYNNDSTINTFDSVFEDPDNPTDPDLNDPDNTQLSFAYTCDVCTGNTARHKTKTIRNEADDGDIDVFDCYSDLSYKLGNCESNNIDGLKDFDEIECTSCSSGYRPRNWADKYLCIENNYFTAVQGVSIENCAELYYSFGAYKCVKCNYPYVLLDDDTCSTICPAGFSVTYSLFEDEAGDISHNVSDSRCVEEDEQNYLEANCLVYSASSDFTDAHCVRCKEGYLPVVNLTEGTVLFDGMDSLTGRPYTPISAGAQVHCIDPVVTSPDTFDVHGNINLSTKLIDGCKYYYELENFDVPATSSHYNYGCLRCEHGKSGVVLDYIHSDTTTLSGYINACEDITGCDITSTEEEFSIGLGFTASFAASLNGLSKKFSCFKCTAATDIPVLFMETGTDLKADQKLKSYYLGNEGASLSHADELTTLNAGHSMSCVTAYDGDGALALTGLIANDLPTADFIVNCALAVYNVASDNDASDNTTADVAYAAADPKLAVHCVSCKPGFSPIFFKETGVDGAEVEGIIKACVPIDGCSPGNEGNWMNSCEDCVHHFDIYTNIVDYTKCSANTPPNCYAAYDVGPCVLCKKGYDKNNDGLCVLEEVPNCAVANLNRNYSQKFGTLNIGPASTYFYEENMFNGCMECEAGYIPIYNRQDGGDEPMDSNFSNYICTNYASEPDLIVEIPNCDVYGKVGITVQKCIKCDSGFILTQEENKCIPDTTFLDCTEVKSEDSLDCEICDFFFINVGGECVLVFSLFSGNCYDFGDSRHEKHPICNRCDDTYMLNSTRTDCIPIDPVLYPSCLSVDNGNCVKCEGTAIKVDLPGGDTYCYPLDIDQSGSMDFDPNCEEVDEGDFSNKIITCTRCSANYFAENSNTDRPTHCGVANIEPTYHCNSYNVDGDIGLIDFRCNGCVDPDDFFFNTETKYCSSRTAVPNCLEFMLDKDKCLECEPNYILTEDRMTCNPLPGIYTDYAANEGYIQTCMAMNTCDSKVLYEGLNSHLSSVFSCHKCEIDTHIPVAVVRGKPYYDGISSLQSYDLNATLSQRYDFGSGGQANICVEPVKESFNIVEDASFLFPENCGAAILNANGLAMASQSTDDVDVERINISVMCVACKPKFYPTSATDDSPGSFEIEFMVSSCTEITNCESSTWFNACSQCNPDHSYGYSEEKGVHYHECISYVANPNCFAVDNADPDNMKCKFCKKGTYLNRDGFCEDIQPPRCQFGGFKFRTIYEEGDLATGLYLSRMGVGCWQCDEDYVGLYEASKDTQVCTQSSYHTNNELGEESNFIGNCKHYKVGKGFDVKCRECKETFVLTVDGNCVSDSNLSNCVLSFNAAKCFKCAPDFVNVDRACVAGAIENCTNYGNDAHSTSQICTRCMTGYFLENNRCVKGEIEDCAIFGNKFTCIQCNEGFGLVRSKNNVNYCYPIDEEINCSVMNYDKLQSGTISCRQCKSDLFIISNDPAEFVRNVCMPFIPVENCVRYDKTQSISDSSFYCLECDQGFFLSGNTCKVRLVQPGRCTSFSLTEDACEECEPEHFLAADGGSCVRYPDGIPGCMTYSSRDKCAQCGANMFLADEECMFIQEEFRLPFCTHYDDPETCTRCNTGYLLLKGHCERINATNCVTASSPNACATCEPGFGIEVGEEDNISHCVKVEVPECAVNKFIAPYDCERCNGEFYVKNGKCEAIKEPIVNCLEYDSEKSCRVCGVGTALSKDKASCDSSTSTLSQIDTNCAHAQLMEEATCSACLPGHYFRNGVCAPCEEMSSDMGCYNCDPEQPTKCLICDEGYYMFDRVCILNGELPPDPKTDDPEEGPIDGPTDPTDPETTGTSRLMVGLLMIVFFLAY